MAARFKWDDERTIYERTSVVGAITDYEHIILNDDDLPVIEGTNMKVIELILDHLAYGWSPEELKFQHNYLTLGQIHSALAYYWDHQDEMDRSIEQRLQRIDQIRQSSTPALLKARLQARGLL